jgi:outer membrane protein TolC
VRLTIPTATGNALGTAIDANIIRRVATIQAGEPAVHILTSLRVIYAAILAALVTIDGRASTGKIAPQSELDDASKLDASSAIRSENADAAWPATDLWKAYADSQLNSWVEAVQLSNSALAAAQARLRAALSMADIAHSALAPQVNGDRSVQREHWADNVLYGLGPLANQNTWNNTGVIALEYHLDF